MNTTDVVKNFAVIKSVSVKSFHCKCIRPNKTTVGITIQILYLSESKHFYPHEITSLFGPELGS